MVKDDEMSAETAYALYTVMAGTTFAGEEFTCAADLAQPRRR